MKRIAIVILFILISTAFCFSSCQEKTKGNSDAYNPVVSLSGDVEDVVTYSFVDRLTATQSMNSIEFVDLYDMVSPMSDIDGALILTHSAKSVYINVECLPYYYLVVNSSGVVAAHSRLDLHSTVCELPLMSVSEIVFIAKDATDKNLTCVYPDKTTSLGLKVMFKAFGFTVQTTEAIEDDKYMAVACNFSAVPITSFLLGHDKVIVKTQNGVEIEVNRISKQQVRWNRGGLCLDSDEYGVNPIIEIDYLD